MKSSQPSDRSSKRSALLDPLPRRGLIPFLMAGYPDNASSLRFALALIDAGAIALEIGVPFSDPVADGPVIQFAAAEAIKGGATLQSSIELVASIKRLRPDTAIVLFTYYNPLYRLGIKAFAERARSAGVDATLVVDLPPEEADFYVREMRAAGLGTIFLASPTSSPERIRAIVQATTGFVYAISRIGITGEAKDLSDSLAGELSSLREIAQALPIAVGFGISTPQQAGAVAPLADAIVIGSRFVSLIQENTNVDEAEMKIRVFASECVRAIDDVHSSLTERRTKR